MKIADLNWDEVDAVFCCLPHATTQEVISSVPDQLKIVDLSADFRLSNVDTYAEWCALACLLPPMSNNSSVCAGEWTCRLHATHYCLHGWSEGPSSMPLLLVNLACLPLDLGQPQSHRIAVARYGGQHKAPELQKEAVYGLTELHRDQIRSARLVANPGCYPTTVQLPLCPLLQVCPFSCCAPRVLQSAFQGRVDSKLIYWLLVGTRCL